MNILHSRVLYSIAFFILVMILVFIVKPAPLFTPNGQIASFGAASAADGAETTVLSLGLVTVAVATLSMLMFSMIDMIHPRDT
jgi:hypothetical protein